MELIRDRHRVMRDRLPHWLCHRLREICPVDACASLCLSSSSPSLAGSCDKAPFPSDWPGLPIDDSALCSVATRASVSWAGFGFAGLCCSPSPALHGGLPLPSLRCHPEKRLPVRFSLGKPHRQSLFGVTYVSYSCISHTRARAQGDNRETVYACISDSKVVRSICSYSIKASARR